MKHMNLRLGLVLLLAFTGLPAANLHAQDAPRALQPLEVGVYVSPPFVMEDEGRFTGMAIELREAVEASLDLAFDYQALPTLRDLVQATADGDLDVAVTNLTIMRDRARRIDELLLEEHGAADGHDGGDDAIGPLGALVLGGLEVASGILGDGSRAIERKPWRNSTMVASSSCRRSAWPPSGDLDARGSPARGGRALVPTPLDIHKLTR